MNLPLILRVLSMRRVLRGHERWRRRQIAQHQLLRLAELRAHAYAHSHFYRKFHLGSETKPLEQLPVLKKSELMNGFDDLVVDRNVRLADVRAHLKQLTSDELYLGKYRVTQTSGSTGMPGIFLADSIEWATMIASYSRAQEWAGIVTGLTRRIRLAVVSSKVPFHQSARVGASVDSPFIPVRRFDSTDKIDAIVAGLNAWQPHNLIAYASMVRILAEEQLSGKLRISPQAVMSASEVLTEESRQCVRRAWSREPFDVYAATETAGIASECSKHRHHLFEDLVITETVDEQNRPVPAGEFGAKLLVTVLFNRTQPLIRYEISDRVALSDLTCDCGLGFALLGGIEGRAEDILELPGRAGVPIKIHPNVFHKLLESLPVRGWQVVQESDAIRILLVAPEPQIDVELLAVETARQLEQQGAVRPQVRVERINAITRTALGKAPLIRSRKV
jgi:putative adenylate-forming enzyme